MKRRQVTVDEYRDEIEKLKHEGLEIAKQAEKKGAGDGR